MLTLDKVATISALTPRLVMGWTQLPHNPLYMVLKPSLVTEKTYTVDQLIVSVYDGIASAYIEAFKALGAKEAVLVDGEWDGEPEKSLWVTFETPTDFKTLHQYVSAVFNTEEAVCYGLGNQWAIVEVLK